MPSEAEVAVVDFACDADLEPGSLVKTAEMLNSQGYRTKPYASQCGWGRACFRGRQLVLPTLGY